MKLAEFRRYLETYIQVHQSIVERLEKDFDVEAGSSFYAGKVVAAREILGVVDQEGSGYEPKHSQR